MFPYGLERVGVVMTLDPDDPREVEGVLNPGSGRTADGRVHLLPRMVAAGNVSRIGLAELIVRDGRPVDVRRSGVVLEPERTWERAVGNAGVEDPRVTWVPSLGLHLMTYVAFGPLGPRTALAVSDDLRHWRRLGPVSYAWDPDTEADLNLFRNKDASFFPEPIRAPDGTQSFAVLHRPMGLLRPFTGDGPVTDTPPGPADPRQSIWISFVGVEDVGRDLRALTVWRGHRLLATPEHDWEQLKVGGGPPPRRVPEGWLVVHHGVAGSLDAGTAQQQRVHYAAGGMILDAERPWLLRQRSRVPLLSAETEREQRGTVPNVVFPTAIEDIDGQPFVFYGMADAAIGAARLIRRGSGLHPAPAAP